MTKTCKTNLIFLTLLLMLIALFSSDVLGQRKQTKRKAQSLYLPIDDQAIKRVEPSYDIYHLGRIESEVVVRVVVDEKGNVNSARAISGHAHSCRYDHRANLE